MPAPWVEDRPGFFRITVAATNCYLVLAADGVTLVDAGLPASRKVLDALLKHLGLRVQDIDAVLLTHGHFDHVGVARSLHASGVPVRVHTADRRLARHPYRYRPAVARVPYLLTHPSGMPIIGRMAAAGALAVRGVDAEASVPPSGVMDVPGRPTVVHTPGHTDGHCAFFFGPTASCCRGTRSSRWTRTRACAVRRSSRTPRRRMLRSHCAPSTPSSPPGPPSSCQVTAIPGRRAWHRPCSGPGSWGRTDVRNHRSREPRSPGDRGSTGACSVGDAGLEPTTSSV